jgi:hypothetical protein
LSIVSFGLPLTRDNAMAKMLDHFLRRLCFPGEIFPSVCGDVEHDAGSGFDDIHGNQTDGQRERCDNFKVNE